MTALAPDDQPGWLIVEDEPLIAMLIEDMLMEVGLKPLGPVARVDDALEIIKSGRPACAFLDVNLSGEKVYPVADVLSDLGVPFAFLTGEGDASLTLKYKMYPVLHKPFSTDQFRTIVTTLRHFRS